MADGYHQGYRDACAVMQQELWKMTHTTGERCVSPAQVRELAQSFEWWAFTADDSTVAAVWNSAAEAVRGLLAGASDG